MSVPRKSENLLVAKLKKELYRSIAYGWAVKVLFRDIRRDKSVLDKKQEEGRTILAQCDFNKASNGQCP